MPTLALPVIYTRDELILLAHAYLDASGMAETTLSIHAAGNDKTISRLFARGDCKAITAERMSAWFTLNWPPHAQWPDGVRPRRGAPRPSRQRPRVQAA
jgi:hypothetical protein